LISDQRITHHWSGLSSNISVESKSSHPLN
jgi:hypothetical protein